MGSLLENDFNEVQKNLAFIALKNEEVANYKSLNKKVFPVKYNGIAYNLRIEESQIAISWFFSTFPAIYENFVIDDSFSKQ